MAAISPIILFTQVLGADIALAVLADAIAVGFILFALIEVFGKISGAHFNPAVTLSMLMWKQISRRDAVLYMIVQVVGGFVGLLISHAMYFDQIPIIFTISTISRSGGAYIAEFLGTLLLALSILVLVNNKSDRSSFVVGILVAGMLIATSSTLFANPQVTLARIFTYSQAGISPFDALIFIVMEILGALVATYVFRVTHLCEPTPEEE
jgi:glycerol uptake facilitator-like aquaporin